MSDEIIPTGPEQAKEPTVTSAPPTGRKFPCAQCGAKLDFNPTAGALKCPFCGHVEQIVEDESADVEERDYHSQMERMRERAEVTLPDTFTQLRCTGCGAVVVLEAKHVTDQCPYCGTHLENLPDSERELIAPQSLLPFKLTDREAYKAFEVWIERLWFAPTELKKIATLGQLNGIYVPHWTYDSMTYSRYTGQRGDDYWVTESYTDSQGKRQTRQVRQTRWSYASGEVQHFFDDVLICASQGLPDYLIVKLPPWDLDALTPFQTAFLANFKTERYTVDLEGGFERAQKIMETEIVRLICQDIGGDHQRITEKHVRYLGITFKHLLLPIWLAHYRYRDKGFQILVNARTGKVAGDRPWSWFKILRLALLIALAIGLILFFVNRSKNPEPSRPDAGQSRWGEAAVARMVGEQRRRPRMAATPSSTRISPTASTCC